MAVQVAPNKPTLIAHGTQRLKLKYGNLLSNFAFNFNSRRYTKPAEAWLRVAECSSELLRADAGTTPGAGEAAFHEFGAALHEFFPPPAQLATSMHCHNPQNYNTRKRAAGAYAQPEFSKRFFTAPMVGGGGAHME